MLDTILSRGIVSILGGFLISLVIGTTYLWGIISIYITSYYRSIYDSSLGAQLTAMVFPFMIFGQAIAMPFGVKLMKKVKAKTICIVVGCLIGISFYLASYAVSFYSFVFLFGIMGGALIGFLYMIPVAHCYKYFPKKKGMVSGIIVAGSGLGTFLFSMVAIQSINPHNVSPNDDGFFGNEISYNVPLFLRELGLICFGAIQIGSFLLLDLLPNMDPYAEAHKHEPQANQKRRTLVALMDQQFEVNPDEEEQKKYNPFGNGMEMGYVNTAYGGQNIYGESSQTGFWNWDPEQADYGQTNKLKNKNKQIKVEVQTYTPANINECPRVRDAVKVKIFWVLFFCMMCGTYFGFLVSGNYKTFGKKYIHNDAYLTFIGAIGSMGNGLSRFGWATLLDKFDFKCLYTTLLIINAALSLTIYYAVRIPQLYMIYVFLAYVCYGGHLGMFPALTSQIFGVRNGSQIYGILFLGFATANAIQFIAVKLFKSTFGYQPIFMLGAILCGVSMLISHSFEFKYDWSQKIRENNDRKRLLAR